MIFRIGLPRILDELLGLEIDSEERGDMGKPIWIPIKLPPNHECSCTCSELEVASTWSIIYNPTWPYPHA